MALENGTSGSAELAGKYKWFIFCDARQRY
jgi:hypothetical protein